MERANCSTALKRTHRFLRLMFGRARHLTGRIAECTCRLIDAFGRLTDLLEQLSEPRDHEVEGVGEVAEHVGRHFTSLGQVSFTDVRHQHEELHQPLLHLVAFFFRLHQGRDSVQHGVERRGHLAQFVLGRNLRAGL